MLIFLALALSSVLESHAQVLHLKPGKVNGFEYVTKDQHVAEVFLNIPYAAPPIHELRFEKPRPVIPWDVRNGTSYGSSCHMLTHDLEYAPDISEDCLTLNIIRPKKEWPPSGFPILFWIHGGAYEYGSAPMYGYKTFADFYIPHDIIVITIQYRLGVYGFFSTGDERMPGNLGLYDMAEALKFVHSNAELFGGDASRITVWGESAGSSAAGQLILSPITRDYIARSIEMSGSPWNSWALGANVPINSLQLAKVLNCNDDIKKCMKQKSPEEIYEGMMKVSPFFHGVSIDSLKINRFGPVIDGEFLQHPDEMSANAPQKASIVGLAKKEAALFSVGIIAPDMLLGIKPEDFPKWNREKLTNVLKRFIQLVYNGKHIEKIVDEVIAFYVDREEEQNYEFYIDRYTEFLSDLLFNVASVEGIAARFESGWRIYAYILDHYNDAIWSENLPKKVLGASHACEHPYAIGDISFYKKFEFDDKEQIVADIFQQSIVEFVKNGTPLNRHKTWPDVGNKLRYLRISPEPEVKSGYFTESASFWNKIREYGYDMAQLLPAKETVKSSKNEL